MGKNPVMGETWTRRLRTARRVMIAVGILNFVIFVATAIYLGGDAVNGKAEGGHYYLYGVRSELGQKVYTEVSERVFTYSKWHVYSVLVTWPFVMTASFFENRARRSSEGK